MKRLTWSIATALVLAVPSIASATNGFVTDDIHLRAGPAWDFPLIADVPSGTPISVLGCTSGWQWCDVLVYGDHGWLPGNAIRTNYQGQRAPIIVYGARIGVPIISFNIGTYWDSYYRGRPFYRERERWYRRPAWRNPPPPRVVPMPHPIPNPPPRVVPMPHPIHNPPPRVVPMPHPIHNPPPRVVPMPHPIHTPPPRVVPMPQPIPNPHVMPQKPAPVSSPQNDQGSH
jgi:uncharacterized protein YraI